MLSMRPFQIVLITVFGILALVGLYVFANFTGSNSGPDVGTVVIWGTLPDSAMTDALNSLKQGHKEYNGISYKQMPAASFDTNLANALAAGTGPNLIIINQEQLWSEAPKLTEIPFKTIPQRTFLDTYLNINRLYLTQTGTYGIPLVVDPLVLYYNRPLLATAQISSPPTDWTQVQGLTPIVTKQNGSQTPTVSAIPFGSYANVTNARAILSLLFMQAGSMIIDTSNATPRSTLGDTNNKSSVTGKTPAQAAVDYFTQFANPALTTYTWNQSLKQSNFVFESGDLALYPGFASEYAQIKAGNPNLDFDMAPIPQSTGGQTHMTYGLAYAFAIPNVNNNKAGAYDAAIALTGTGIVPPLALELGMVPAQKALVKVDPSNALTAVYYPEALSASGWLSPPPFEVDAAFSAIISGVTSGRYETQDALNNADKTLNADY
jgi:ABC-type glycerol-3-phosphate transport system substrate-binding protein